MAAGVHDRINVQNNPLKYNDPEGNIPVETIADVISIGFSAYSLITQPSWANLGFLAWDVAATVVPYVPGSYAGKTVKAGSKVFKGVSEAGQQTARYADNAVGFVDEAGSAVKNALDASKTGPSVGDLRKAGQKDAHHIIQDASVKDLPGYKTNAAPGVQLPGPSNVKGTPHYKATQAQRSYKGGNYGEERRNAYKALKKSGMSHREAREHIQRADRYFNSIGVGPNTPTRIPGNR